MVGGYEMKYEVYDINGRLMLISDTRYDTSTEKQMIKSGYKIKLDGKPVK